MVLPQGVSIADVSVVHPLSVNTLPRAAATVGATASTRDQHKGLACGRVGPTGYVFVPIFVESYGCLGMLAMKLLHELGDEADGPGGVSST
jgi:hypothetical protein